MTQNPSKILREARNTATHPTDCKKQKGSVERGKKYNLVRILTAENTRRENDIMTQHGTKKGNKKSVLMANERGK